VQADTCGKNILFIICDQLRADYLGCYGHPGIKTPVIDRLARRGVRFTSAYCQSPVCVPSRASFYTGRYAYSHGVTWNNVPLNVSESTIGDYLRPLGHRVGLVGIIHIDPDRAGMERLGIRSDTPQGDLVAQAGFEPWERDDQLHPDEAADTDFAYNRYLRARGYEGRNPWHSHTYSASGPDGELLSGWQMRHAHLPARVREEDSETAYLTDRAIEFIADSAGTPWCLHLSYMKPHWPYMAPAPYHRMYAPDDVLPANRAAGELDDPHPVVRAFMNHEDSRSFQDEDRRRHVIPTYMGLISQLDTHIGRLLDFLERTGQIDDTLIILTSDHGGYLGDHWLGEKYLFHEESVRIPLIVVDPAPEADALRGTACDAFVETVDVLPTLLDWLGRPIPAHVLEGHSLLPLLRTGTPPTWRDMVVSEHDYAFLQARLDLGLPPSGARSYMVRTREWKYVLFEGFRPQLFDLQQDPRELVDLGGRHAAGGPAAEMHERLFTWMRHRAVRTTLSDADIDRRTASARRRGIHIEIW
jgi:arylsulfatase A-like enzyme